MSTTEMPRETFTVLVVCTGNICRSALAERLGRGHVEAIVGADAIKICSAGTHAVVGSEMHPDSALVLKGFGGESAGFVARQLLDEQIMDADLVLTMTRDHRRDVLTLAPRALARTFTLLEAADLAGILGDDIGLPGETLPERARALVKAMATARSRRESGTADDVRDPIHAPVEVHEEIAEVITRTFLPLLDRIVALRTDDGPR